MSTDSTLTSYNLIQRLKQSLPIDDLMAWLIKEHPKAQLQEIMDMLSTIYQGGFKITPASETQTNYQVGDKTLKASPQRVEVK
ncbi:MAG: hypothetical protein GY938_08850 [Ketobacter sp.]|nr:hypothetical protein [Ketobacter sp.]